ncbi:MAG: tRNA 2-thiouridine(34) synthase MnmA [Patescibacteria group bacterium]
MKKDSKKLTVAIGLSGGVDSSVAAAILKNQGYKVIGFFLHFWSEEIKGECRDNICCSLDAQEDARRVATDLGIPFYTLNLKNKFKEKIVDNFLADYEAGQTPNPCVRCNTFIKFGEFMKKAQVLGVDFLATGHYAKIKKVNNGNKTVYHLLNAKDKNKDQTYFLHGLNQKQLAKIIFPVGGMKKDEVRKLAEILKIKTAKKKESQEVCFVHKGLADFLSRYLKLKQGSIVDKLTGKVLGKHSGRQLFTFGQRKGLGLGGGPWFVVGFDNIKNTVFVSNNEKELLVKEFLIKEVNWLAGFPKEQKNIKCCVRYHGDLVGCEIKKSGKFIKVICKKPLRAVTTGQSCVFYHGPECLGGGLIM